MVELVRVRRGVRDAAGAADFYGWLLDVVPERGGDAFRISCANGDLLLHEDPSTPVTVELSVTDLQFRGADPDGVPVSAAPWRPDPVAGSATLDHVRLNCADVLEAMRFYRRLGLVVTWSAGAEEEVDGLQEEPVAGAGWVHVSGADGYLSLSQADWKDCRVHKEASGPPRFIHVGFAVDDLSRVRARLKSASIPHLRAPSSGIGERLYLNDPEGIRELGTNIELVEYAPEVERSGKFVGARS
jgi:catechol 2,3-dioxygenase-like lactoylglutathione lyase family enzyme